MKAFSSRVPLFAALIASSAVPASRAQTTATTDPVGFITLNATGQPAATSFSFKALGLTLAIDYQGAAERVGNLNGTTRDSLTDNEATWTNDQFNLPNATVGSATHYVEIIRPVGAQNAAPGEGTTYDILRTDAASKTLTLEQEIASGVTAGAVFKVRKHWTISSVFGPANSAGLAGGALETADQILVFDSAANQYRIYFYQTQGSGTGWRLSTDLQTDASLTVLYPDEGLVIRKQKGNGTAIVLAGAVKMGSTSIPVLPGTNLLGNVFASPMTLDSSNLYNGNSATGLAGGNLGTADHVLIHNGVGYDIYYFELPNALNPSGGWRNASKPNQAGNLGSVPIPVGTSIIVKRNSATGFDWKVPQHPAAL